VADLLDEFMSQYSPDPQLKAKFLAFMASQADTKYSVVDNKLNWWVCGGKCALCVFVQTRQGLKAVRVLGCFSGVCGGGGKGG
jgi:hypothetical protein